MSAPAGTLIQQRSDRPGGRAAFASLVVGVALVSTFAIGRWSAGSPSTVQPLRQPLVIQTQHSAPQHDGVVKQG
jgi:hypothetical protein